VPTEVPPLSPEELSVLQRLGCLSPAKQTSRGRKSPIIAVRTDGLPG
jgi:hypothetical protein